MRFLAAEAISPVIANLLLCAIAVIVAVLVFLFCRGFSFVVWNTDEPCIFEIVDINHTDEDDHHLNYDSRVSLWYNPNSPSKDENTTEAAMTEFWERLGVHKTEPDRTHNYVKNDLYPIFFKNGQKVYARIKTMEAHEFIPTHHTGVQYITGEGSKWCPNGRIIVDFTDGTFRPGDVVRVEIRDVGTDALISADTYTA